MGEEEQMQDTGMSQQEQQEFVQFLAQILQAKSTDELQSKLEVQTKKDPDFIKKAYQAYQNYKKQGSTEQQPTYAKLGAKINYINKLNGKCPEGYDMYKEGGCLKCKKKKAAKDLAEIKTQMKIKNRFGKDQDDSRGSFMQNGIK